jgi:hypothetical protein
MIEDLKVSAEYEERKQNVEEFNKVSWIMNADNYYSHKELLMNTLILEIWLNLDGFVFI